MYKLLLCWRYLRTRYIALASIVSVTLGVATMIVVNAVMAGFSEKMRDRLHGILADIVVESKDLDGFRESAEVMERIRQAAGDDVVAMAAAMETFGLMKIDLPNGRSITRQVQILGVRPEERARTGDFAEFLFREDGRPAPPSFEVTQEILDNAPPMFRGRDFDPDFDEPQENAATQRDLIDEQGDEFFNALGREATARDEAQDHGAILGYALATHHIPGKGDVYLAPEGAKVTLSFVRGGRKPAPGHDRFTVVGFFRSGMSEYDSSMVYVPLERLQYIRVLGDGKGKGAVNQIQVKVRQGADLDRVAQVIRQALDPHQTFFVVSTWEQKQGPLLAAVSLEQGILNILLFLIIAVAGFGILAIFSMIVVEKTRDIGILKALGASNSGVRSIFLGYGLLLGLVGSGVGMIGGLAFVERINDIEAFLSRLTGRKVFDDRIYYFTEIPTLIDPWTVAAIVVGALVIAVAASIWPAHRASQLHPVQALRYE
jgi:lipoprotein-releasing system permease protein